MKKLLSIMLALALCVGCLSLTGCSGDKATAAKYKIGIVQLVEHEALDAATEGFKQAIIDELGEDAVEFDFHKISSLLNFAVLASVVSHITVFLTELQVIFRRNTVEKSPSHLCLLHLCEVLHFAARTLSLLVMAIFRRVW